MNIDAAYNDVIAEYAVKHDRVIAVHSYPSSAREQDRDEYCFPIRIERWMDRYPGMKVIVCHLGGFQWEDAVKLNAFFDISSILPDLVDRYGTHLVGYIRRNVCVPLPRVNSLEELNVKLLEKCVEYLNHQVDSRPAKVGVMLEEDRHALQPIPTYAGK